MFRSGFDLEDAIFGCHSSGDQLVNKFKRKRKDFSVDLTRLISKSSDIHPNTQIGESLYWLIKKELEKLGVDTTGFVFVSAIDSITDLRHFSDGVFFLPSAPQFPITVDAYNIDPKALDILKDFWVDEFAGNRYDVGDFQSDLFRYKNGSVEWKRNSKTSEAEGFMLVSPVDFRQHTRKRRPENHFIITPRDIGDRAGRRAFARMVARYLASKVPSQEQKMALLSHK
jgi:hypothetical protein